MHIIETGAWFSSFTSPRRIMSVDEMMLGTKQ